MFETMNVQTLMADAYLHALCHCGVVLCDDSQRQPRCYCHWAGNSASLPDTFHADDRATYLNSVVPMSADQASPLQVNDDGSTWRSLFSEPWPEHDIGQQQIMAASFENRHSDSQVWNLVESDSPFGLSWTASALGGFVTEETFSTIASQSLDSHYTIPPSHASEVSTVQISTSAGNHQYPFAAPIPNVVEDTVSRFASAHASKSPLDVYTNDSLCNFASPLSPNPTREKSTSFSATGTAAVLLEETSDIVGFIQRNGKLKCNQVQCSFITFGRATELKRHYKSFHASEKPEFWCPVHRCRRSKGVRGGKSFQRKDKLKDHMMKIHKDVAFQRK